MLGDEEFPNSQLLNPTYLRSNKHPLMIPRGGAVTIEFDASLALCRRTCQKRLA